MQRMAASVGQPLHEDLQPYLIEDGALGMAMLKHPLVFAVPMTLPGIVNEQYEHKLKAVDEAIAENNVHRFVFLHERPHRLEAVLAAMEFMSIADTDLASLLASVWSDSENIWQNYDEWHDLLEPGLGAMAMDEQEQALYESLDETVTIYRGAHVGYNEEGMSWTLKREIGVWFAHRFANARDHGGVLLTGTVAKADIRAVVLDRSEAEVVVFPEDVTITERTPSDELPAQRRPSTTQP